VFLRFTFLLQDNILVEVDPAFLNIWLALLGLILEVPPGKRTGFTVGTVNKKAADVIK
jgi:hypothetical protein